MTRTQDPSGNCCKSLFGSPAGPIPLDSFRRVELIEPRSFEKVGSRRVDSTFGSMQMHRFMTHHISVRLAAAEQSGLIARGVR